MSISDRPEHPALAAFSPATRAWFSTAFDAPTSAQVGAWDAVRQGNDALVVAPTGSGKTLAAFLWSLDRLATTPRPDDPHARTRVLYLSPLKALAVDVERNLRAPLAGITAAAARLGVDVPDLTTGIRTGDTPADARRRLVQHPPDILITTPESLYLMLTSQARSALMGVEHVIVDEVHAVAGTKRGAHLALSLERLDALLPQPAVRIGLSATVRPVDEVARFLSGSRADRVRIVQPTIDKRWDLRVEVPVEDLSLMGEPTDVIDGASARGPRRASVWPHVEERIVDLIGEHRTTLVFANSRRLAERLCARLNEVSDERTSTASTPPTAPSNSTMPAEIIGGSGTSQGAPPALARAHHGSVSREERAHIEDDLKRGLIPAVVATSTLELGIDMGDIDLVVQVESPPSVASGLQRVGRAGHQVGAVSRGVLMPKYRGDLVQTAVVVERMQGGLIEAMRIPTNPLDVLAQHIVAATAVDDWDADDLYDLVRRAAPYRDLPRSAYDAVLDMLAGRYPSDAFAELRPRIVWDRATGQLSGRPGSQRLAVTSGGTIPDRGLFGVFLVGEKAVRVGELDEEMVYESRLGDVFTLGASSWRIEEITHDRVLVSPAPGQPGRLPFWRGDPVGRPYELGAALGEFVRTLAHSDPESAHARLASAGLNDNAENNLLDYLAEQRQATGHVPDDRTIVVERFRDELGDWRVVLHSPFGAQVHAPWSLIIGARLQERFGIDAQVAHSDDGIVVRLPDTQDDPHDLLAYLIPDADEVEDAVTTLVGGSAMFAARFRECAARALLLPRRDPGKRSPLWQQRQRSAQLLSVVSEHPTFPIALEAVRECLQDIFDVPALQRLLTDVAARKVKVVEVTTESPSPFARSLLFGYVGEFLYEGDAPLAERRAQALTLDATLLAELLGRVELRDLLDTEVIAAVEAQLQRLDPERRIRGPEGVADLLRDLGPLSSDGLVARGAEPPWIDAMVEARRAMVVRVGVEGAEVLAAVEDAARLRDALGTALPRGIADAFLEPASDPLADLLARYARTHGPFTAEAVAADFGLGIAVVVSTLERLQASGSLVAGAMLPGVAGSQWCDSAVLRRIRRATIAALRDELEPVPPVAIARFLPQWQSIGGQLRGVDGVARVVEQLDGLAVPAVALESFILPARVSDYSPMLLDHLTSSGDVLWCGRGGHAADLWVSLHLADTAPLTLPILSADDADDTTPLQDAVLSALNGGGALFFRDLATATGSTDDAELVEALWDLVARGHLTNDTLAPLRTWIAGRGNKRTTAPPRTARRGRYGRIPRSALPSRSGPPSVAGRWSLLPGRDPDPTKRGHLAAELLLDRYGLITRGAVANEGMVGGFAQAYRVLRAFEESGRLTRGYVVEGLGAAQFAAPGSIDAVRIHAAENRPAIAPLVLAAADPANPYGAALPWPSPRGVEGAPKHRPGRKAGAAVVLVDGELVLYVERGGRTVLSWADDADVLAAGARALADAVSRGSLGRIIVERADGASVMAHDSALGAALESAGFVLTPRGLRARRA